jgi:hypothetical protein
VQIAFLPGETNDTSLRIVWFLAVVDGRYIHCGISYQTLRTHFEADVDDPLPAFIAYRAHIEQAVTAFLRQHRLEEEVTILLGADNQEEPGIEG